MFGEDEAGRREQAAVRMDVKWPTGSWQNRDKKPLGNPPAMRSGGASTDGLGSEDSCFSRKSQKVES